MGKCAFLVGIDAYPTNKQQLRCAVADAQECSTKLARVGFRCAECENVNVRQFDLNLANFIEKTIQDSDHFILFNFNGHCELAKGKPTLIFSDGEVPLEDVTTRLMKSKCSKNAEVLLLMNCCRCGEIDASELSERSQKQTMGKNTENRYLTIIWASALGRPAGDSDGDDDVSFRCSSFMRGFLACVEKRKTLHEVYIHISETVQSSEANRKLKCPLRQRPWFSTDSTSSRSDFFLPDPDLRTCPHCHRAVGDLEAGAELAWSGSTGASPHMAEEGKRRQRDMSSQRSVNVYDWCIFCEAPIAFLLCSALHFLVWCVSLWKGKVLVQSIGWSFGLMVIAFFWSAFSYNEQGHVCWPAVETHAVKWWLPFWVACAQGYMERIGKGVWQQVLLQYCHFCHHNHGK